MWRYRAVPALLFVVVTACSGETRSVFPAATTATGGGSTTTVDTIAGSEPPQPTTTAVPTTASTTTAPAGLEPIAVLVRYDGASGAATLEGVACNGSDTALGPTEVMIEGQSVGPIGPVDPGTCAVAFDASLGLGAFGITAPGTHPVTLAVDDVMAEWAVPVAALTVTPDPDEYVRYEECVAQGGDVCPDWVKHEPVPGEILVTNGEVQAIAPVEIETLATLSALTQANCVFAVEQYLGLAGPRPVSHRYVFDDYTGAYAAGMISWTTSGQADAFVGALDDLGRDWAQVMDDRCGSTTAHELTHLVLGQVPMPGYLNEGLATWMQLSQRSNSDQEIPNAECGEDAWYGWDWEAEVDTWVPYSDLDAPDPDVPGIYHYYTGMCFWDHLERTYGLETIRQIVQVTQSYDDFEAFNGCTPAVESVYFIRDIVEPILGESISELTEARWGFGATFTGCEGV